MYESDLVSAVTKYLTASGFLTQVSVRIPPREIDIVALNPADATLLLVEAKLDRWKRAINQARRNLLFGHYSFVSVPEEVVSKLNFTPFHEHGIGLISVGLGDGKVKIELPARLSNQIVRPFKIQLYRGFREGWVGESE